MCTYAHSYRDIMVQMKVINNRIYINEIMYTENESAIHSHK